jgi:hypothetical protein
LDGARDSSGRPVVYFTRKKLKAGRYFLLYRVAFNSEDKEGQDDGTTPKPKRSDFVHKV